MTFTANDVGCYLDGHMGRYNSVRAVELAGEHGFPVTPEDRAAMTLYDEGPCYDDATGEEQAGYDDAFEHVVGQGGLVDAATDFLQSRTVEGLAWIWDMGELSLCAVDDDGEPLH